MVTYEGCTVRLMPLGDWAVCWPDATVLDRGYPSKRSAQHALKIKKAWEVRRNAIFRSALLEQTAPEPGKFERQFEQPLASGENDS